MPGFDFWQRWGLGLSDEQFADAFLALGLLAGGFPSPRAGTERRSPPPGAYQPGGSPDIEALEGLLTTIVGKTRRGGRVTEWRFPGADQVLRVGGSSIRVRDIDPLRMADAWGRVAVESPSDFRIAVTHYPAGDPVIHWFRILLEASPRGKSVHLELDAPLPVRRMSWPLRLGYFPGDGAETIVRKALELWPARELARAVGIDRDNSDCDILVFNGTLRRLLRILIDMPGSQKCIGVILRGAMEDDQHALPQRIALVAAESHANGLVFLHAGVSDDTWAQALNVFLESLSHDLPLDRCVSNGFALPDQTDMLAFLSRELSRFHIGSLLETIGARLKALPQGTRLPVERDAFARMNMPTGRLSDRPLAETVLRTFRRHTGHVVFHAESSGALGMARMSEAIDRAELPEEVTQERARRFLQQQSLIRVGRKYRLESRTYLRGVPTLVRVRIGPPDEHWISIPEEFPEERLPEDAESWRLTVVMTEPLHMKKPELRFIRLGRSGPSTECEFRFTPGAAPTFEGRITVLHRGRVLQTAVLKAFVAGDESEIPAEASIQLTELIQVRQDMGDLDKRRQFDLALVLNHTTDDRPRLQAVSPRHAWIADISECRAVASDINDALSKVAKSVKDYSGDLDSPRNRALLIELAQYGRMLHGHLVEDQLMAPTNRAEIAGKEYIQIVSARSDALVPFEFIYEHETPDDDAVVCPSWRTALEEGRCPETCDITSGKTVCPLGFWGVSKVIERHIYTPELAEGGREIFLQSECASGRERLDISGAAMVAASRRVDDESLQPILASLELGLGAPPQRARDWAQWATLVQQHRPNLLIALPHTDGHGAKATLEIGGKTIKSIQIKDIHVRPQASANAPIAALLGCDTTGTAMEYGSHVAIFRRKGAAVVIGTIATVFGKHAARVAEQLVEGLKPRKNGDRPERLGEVMRSIKRKALLDGLLMALCVVAFGDADWKLDGKESR